MALRIAYHVQRITNCVSEGMSEKSIKDLRKESEATNKKISRLLREANSIHVSAPAYSDPTELNAKLERLIARQKELIVELNKAIEANNHYLETRRTDK